MLPCRKLFGRTKKESRHVWSLGAVGHAIAPFEAFQDGYFGQTQLNLQHPSGLPPQEWLQVWRKCTETNAGLSQKRQLLTLK